MLTTASANTVAPHMTVSQESRRRCDANTAQAAIVDIERMEELKSERIKKDEKIKPEIIKILSDYKALYIRKKQDAVRSLLKVINSKDSNTKKYMLSSIQQLSILNER